MKQNATTCKRNITILIRVQSIASGTTQSDPRSTSSAPVVNLSDTSTRWRHFCHPHLIVITNPYILQRYICGIIRQVKRTPPRNVGGKAKLLPRRFGLGFLGNGDGGLGLHPLRPDEGGEQKPDEYDPLPPATGGRPVYFRQDWVG
ncbi:hypothetical protein [Larkinella sp.]|uniref:hypothetical protein n=1 Tax=Larkinella sp. TaxID=2034517 RepID=UPI003BA86819